MKREVVGALLGTALLVLAAGAAGAEELTVHSILAAQRAGAAADSIIAKVKSPANTVVMTAEDLVTLRNAGVPESVITVILGSMPAPARLQSVDSRPVGTVPLIDLGSSETQGAAQAMHSGDDYDLSVNEQVYLNQSGAWDSSTVAVLATPVSMAAAPAILPSELVFDGLVMVRRGFWKKDRAGRLVMRGDTLGWEDSSDRRNNLTFETKDLEKVWFTCEARSSGDSCHQINFQVVKGNRYRFRDVHGDPGPNAAVLKIMEALRMYSPTTTYTTPDVAD